MAEKPDYTDFDWTFLIKDREAKWKVMMDFVDERGWKKIPLRTSGGFTSQLILLPRQEEKRGIFIVCAGGGFRFKSSNEALPVAEFFHGKGLNAAILDYHVDRDGGGDEVLIEAGEDGLEAVRQLRAHADELGIMGDHIAIGGFSAGGMTSGYAATHFDAGDPARGIAPSRPDAALILYGSMSRAGIRENVGTYDPAEQRRRAALDIAGSISEDTPPMFLFQTHKDDPRHALQLGFALASRGVPFEIHTFEQGDHGWGLYDGGDPDSPLVPHTKLWGEIAADWLVMRGF